MKPWTIIFSSGSSSNGRNRSAYSSGSWWWLGHLLNWKGFFFHIHRPWLKERNSSMNNIRGSNQWTVQLMRPVYFEHPVSPLQQLHHKFCWKAGLELIAEDIQEMAISHVSGYKGWKLIFPCKHKLKRWKFGLDITWQPSGALYEPCRPLLGENWLDKIESRPLKTALGEYFSLSMWIHTDKDLVHFARKDVGISIKFWVPILLSISDHGKERRWVKENPLSHRAVAFAIVYKKYSLSQWGEKKK